MMTNSSKPKSILPGVPMFDPHLARVTADMPSSVQPKNIVLPGAAEMGFIAKKMRDVRARSNVTNQDFQTSLLTYREKLTKVFTAFRPFLSDYDLQIVLPTTCALGIIKPTHTDLDEKGLLGQNTDVEYPQEVVDSVMSLYRRHIVTVKPSLTMVRGKNAGWPHPVGGRRREVSDFLLAFHVAASLGAKKRGMRLRDLTTAFSQYHGEHYLIYGERRQHTSKPMPVFTKDGTYASFNAVPRVRGIYFSPKYMVAWNRTLVKRALATLLKTPMHVQDRPTITARIKKMKAADPERVVALDVSRFDQSFGGKRGLQVLRAIGSTFGTPADTEDLISEFTTPILTFSHNRPFMAPGGSILSSGLGSTTIIGCIGNFITTVAVLAQVCKKSGAQIIDDYGKGWDLLAWGDDTVLRYPKTVTFDEVKKGYASFKIDVDVEPTLKYLGSNYDRGSFEGSMSTGYSVGRFLQQQFFPEHPKKWPFSVVGYIARLELIEPSLRRKVHDVMLRQLWDVEFRTPFSLDQTQAVLRSIIPEVEKYANRIQEMDDVLLMLTHGLTDNDLIQGDVADEFLELLGSTQADLSDPVKFMRDKGFDTHTATLMELLTTGALDAIPSLNNVLLNKYSLSWPGRGPIY